MDLITDPINAVYFSRFILKKDGNGGGGERRVSQIFDIIKDYNPRFLSVPQNDYADESLNLPDIKFSNLKPNDLEFKKIVTGGEYFFWSEKFRNNIAYLRVVGHKWADLVNTKLPVDIAFVDEPLFFAPLIDKLNDLNVPIIGLEQNIETLVRGQVEEKYQHELFKKEIEYFKKCDLVITISDEDTVLLNNFGVHTFHIPYYPICEQVELFLKIRHERSKRRTKKDYILLGTAGNIPTLEGMLELAKKWAASEELKNKILHVVGYGTEKVGELLSLPESGNVRILGGVDEDTLHALLQQVKASIIFQSNGTGALCKIAELLIAGVPVYANHHAARSYHNIQGLIEYHNFFDLINRLLADGSKKQMLDIPIPEPPQNDFILKTISGIVKESSDKEAKKDYQAIIQNQSNIIRELRLRAEKAEAQLKASEADRAARLEVIQQKEQQLRRILEGYSYRLGHLILWPLKKLLNK